MVVDDETWGRKSVSKMITELSLDVEVIAEARHGQEALEIIQMSKPHIVVTDMNMPIMNGERFLESLYTQHSDIRVIVISGYSQFEYMKAALTYQACEYVLKPISMIDLRNAMMKAIDASRNYVSLQQQKKYTQDIQKLKREEFLQHVTSKRITNLSDIYYQSEELGISNPMGSYRLAVCMFRQFSEVSKTKFHGNADLFMFSVDNILYEVMQDDVSLIYKSDDRMSICLVLKNSLYDDQRIRKLAASFHEAMILTLQTDVIVGLSSLYANLDMLPEAYSEAMEELKKNQLEYSGLTLSAAGHSASDSISGILTSFDMKTFKNAFGAGNGKDCRRLLLDFVHRVSKRPATTIRDVQRELAKIIELASYEMKGLVSTVPSLFDARLISGILDMKQLRGIIDQFVSAIDAYHLNAGESVPASSIQQIVAYLDSHYFEDVSLIDVATRFHLDPSYLSKLFKTVTNEILSSTLRAREWKKHVSFFAPRNVKSTKFLSW